MNRIRAAGAAFVLTAVAGLTIAAAAPALADNVDGTGSFEGSMGSDSPDPMESTYPGYWEGGGHAGGTGDEAQNNSPGYSLGGEHAGGTGNDSQDDFPGYSQGGQSAGGF